MATIKSLPSLLYVIPLESLIFESYDRLLLGRSCTCMSSSKTYVYRMCFNPEYNLYMSRGDHLVVRTSARYRFSSLQTIIPHQPCICSRKLTSPQAGITPSLAFVIMFASFHERKAFPSVWGCSACGALVGVGGSPLLSTNQRGCLINGITHMILVRMPVFQSNEVFMRWYY
jgi:hypothetical protein